MAKHKVGVIGCGGIARKHAEGYAAEDRCEVVALVDINEEAAHEYAEDTGFTSAEIYTDYHEMLQKARPDIVSVCLWPQLHKRVSVDCAEAGVRAIHCEKPMAPTWGESLDMAKRCAELGAQLTFNHQRRFTPGIVRAKEMLGDGVFGELQRMELWAPAHLLDCGTHSIDLGFMFNGDVPAVWAMGQIDARQTKNWFDVPCEFAAIGHFKFENDVRAIIYCGDDKEKGTGARLYGSDGFIEVSWGGTYGAAAIYSDSDWEPPSVEEASPMPAAMRDIVDCLESGEEPKLAAVKALRATEVVFALYESSRRRARVDLPLAERDSAFATMLNEGVIGAAS